MQNGIRTQSESEEPMIGIEDACKILSRAKTTIYALAQARKIPYYRPGKMLQFKRSELMQGWRVRNVTIRCQQPSDFSKKKEKECSSSSKIKLGEITNGIY